MHHPDAATRDDVAQGRGCACSSACARAGPARPLHHQRGGAEFHRQCAAGGRLRAVDDAVGRGDRRLRRRRATRCWSISAPSTPSGAQATEIAVKTAAQGQRALGARSGLRRPQRRRARTLRARWSAAARQVVRLNRAEFSALAGQRAVAAKRSRPLRAPTRPWSALSGETDLDHRRRASSRPSPTAIALMAKRHRHGLRRLGAGRRLSCGRAGRLARRGRRAA